MQGFIKAFGKKSLIVGKTTIIYEFVKDKETIYFTGLESNVKENLEALSKSVMGLSEDFDTASAAFTSYKEALDTVFQIAKNLEL